MLSFQWLAGQPQWQQPSLSRLARSAWVLDETAATSRMFQPDGYPAVRGSYTLRRSLATFHGTWSFSTGYSGLSTVEVAGTIDFSRRQPVLRIAYSAGQTLAAVLNCNDLSCTRYGSLDVQGVQGHRAPAQGLKSRRARPGVGAAVAPPRSRPLPARASGGARRLLPHRGERVAAVAASRGRPLVAAVLLGGRPGTPGQDTSVAPRRRATRGVPRNSRAFHNTLRRGARSNVGLPRLDGVGPTFDASSSTTC